MPKSHLTKSFFSLREKQTENRQRLRTSKIILRSTFIYFKKENREGQKKIKL